MKPRQILIVALVLALQPGPVPAGGLIGEVFKALVSRWFASPAHRQDMLAQSRAYHEEKYAHLVRKLNLSPEVTERFYDLLDEQTLATIKSATSPNGVPIETRATRALRDLQEQQMEELIGVDGLIELSDYDETFEYRNEVNRLQLHFVVGTDLLREDQVEAMIGILRDAAEEYWYQGSINTEFPFRSGEIWQASSEKSRELRLQRDARILAEAGEVLTPVQLAAFEADIRLELVHLALMDMARRVSPALSAGTNDDLLVRDSEYRKVWLVHERLQVLSTYRDVPRLLGLSPQLTDQFFSLMIDQRLAALANPARTSAAWDDQLRREERERRALLGERGLAQFNEWQEAFDYRMHVKYLQIDIGGGDDALQEDQVELLIALWYDAAREMRRFQRSEPFHFFMSRREREKLCELGLQRNLRIHASAATFLTPAQLAALDARLRRDPL